MMIGVSFKQTPTTLESLAHFKYNMIRHFILTQRLKIFYQIDQGFKQAILFTKQQNVLPC